MNRKKVLRITKKYNLMAKYIKKAKKKNKNERIEDNIKPDLLKRKDIIKMINKDELLYKLNAVIEYLKNSGGYEYKLYNHLYPGYGKPDSNIAEYAENLLVTVQELINIIIYHIRIKDLDELTSFAFDFLSNSFFIWCLQNGVHITNSSVFNY